MKYALKNDLGQTPIKTYLCYLLLAICLNLCLTSCGGNSSSPSSNGSNLPGTLVIASLTESSIALDHTITATVSLNGSQNVTQPVIVSIYSNASNILSISPENCSLISTNSSCSITLTGESVGVATFSVAANSYPTQTSESITVIPFYQVLYSFGANGGTNDGQNPLRSLVFYNGLFYGTTYNGGTSGNGTVFSISPAGVESVIYSFGDIPDGTRPNSALVFESGLFYGTTYSGGTSNHGTVFSISPSGVESIIYSFAGGPTDGLNPGFSLIFVNGIFYGIAGGGESGLGVVFGITPSGVENIIHSFTGYPSDGSNAFGNLIFESGLLYGTTFYGGSSNQGVVYSLSTSGIENIVLSFSGNAYNPRAGLLFENGAFYGTTTVSNTGYGTVYSVSPSGVQNILYIFGTNGGASDARIPGKGASLISVNGVLYDTTDTGGTSAESGGCGTGCGTVYSVTPSGAESVIWSFGNNTNDGENPQAGLVYYDGYLYGTTEYGGESGSGTVFRIAAVQ